MRKLIALFVLLILPLQLAFAAGAEYCDLENVDTGQHFGHHAHDADASGNEPDPGKAPAESNCAFCHLGCAHAQASSFQLHVSGVAIVPFLAAHIAPVDFSPPILERPPRLTLA